MNALNLLKNCPFCGGHDLSIETYDVQPDNYHGGYVRCDDCDTQGRSAITLDGWLSNEDEARRAAIAAWNRRHDETPSEFERLCGKENSHV